ncbi:MAG: amidohydrolase [Clostridiales bacterium]|nr:amidohydrolase [Clostridiales bacterium]
MKGSLFTQTQQYAQEMVNWRRYLHQHGEVGFDLPDTFAFVWSELEKMGYTLQKCGKCGIVAIVGTGRKTILLRADMDALPLEEESGLSFASTRGTAHACGHDLHTAMLLGAARLLKDREGDLHGRVKLMFQPAEEILEGAMDMIDHGVLENPKPDVALMIHVMNAEDMKTGMVIIPEAGVSAPAANMFEIVVHGKGCHGAMPHTGVDPINAASHIVLALQAISCRELSLSDSHALTVASFRAGDSCNVIPEKAVLQGSVRSYSNETQAFLRRRIEQISECTARTFNAETKVNFISGCPTLLNDQTLVNQANEILRGILGAEYVFSVENLKGSNQKSTGSEDFSYLSHQLPSLMLALAAGDGSKPLPLHHPKVIFSEDTLVYGAAVYAGFALEWLARNQ